MSNQSNPPPNPNVGKGLKAFGEAIGKAAQKARQDQLTQMGNEGVENNSVPRPAGALPIPASQMVFEDRFEWIWEAVPEEVHVYVVMDRGVEPEKEQWSIRLNCVDTSMQLTPDESKAVGEALLAAWQYQYVWKQNFADMFVTNTLEVKPLHNNNSAIDKAIAAEAKKPVKKTAKRTLKPVDEPIDLGDDPDGDTSVDPRDT